MSYPEADWLDGARRLDEERLGAIYDAFSPELYRYACRLLGDTGVAEDLVAATFYRFLQALHAGGGPQKHLRAYLYRITHNLAMDHYRRQPVEVVSSEEVSGKLSSGSDPDEDLERELTQEEVRTALWQLTPEQRQVVVLKFLQGISNDEIASTMGKSIGAVKALQHRGLAALRRILLAKPEISEVER
jgi:RNA polymerase sigma-70 factor (ECF subfamily)